MTQGSITLTLHGYPVSNYVNVVRAALIEKGLDYRLVVRGGAQDDAFLALSPMGKIPVLETESGPLAETIAIIEYLDDRYREPTLRPTAPYEVARARQIMNIIQVYVEVPTRALFPGVFMGGENSAAQVAASRATLDRATTALSRLVAPGRFLVGSTLTSADLFAFYNLDIGDRLSRFVWGRSIVREAGLGEWHAAIRERASSAVVLADFEDYFARYLLEKGAAYRASDIGHHSHA